MDNNLEATIAKLRAAADAANDAANAAHTYADQLAATAHAATGGAIDPLVKTAKHYAGRPEDQCFFV